MPQKAENQIQVEIEKHYIKKSGWLRASVLGANDGILSTTSIAIGIAAASATRAPIVLATLAALVAGALSMAAGEYVSVSSQRDIENADLEREKQELKYQPETELNELANIYKIRGLDSQLAMQVALKLTENNALESHARDELGINESTRPQPLQATFASGVSFLAGGLLPFFVSLFIPVHYMVICLYVLSIVFLSLLGGIAAKTGGSNIIKSILRICFWGTIAMAITAFIGYLFGQENGGL